MVSPRVIATDLDGTLLRFDGSLSPRTIDTLSAADAAGLRVVVVTARPPAATWMIADRLPCAAVVCANGAFTHLPDRAEPLVRALGQDTSGTVVEKLLAAVPDLGFAVETGDGLVYEPAFELSEWAAQAPWSTEVDGVGELLERAAPIAKLLARAAETPLHDMRVEAQSTVGALAEVTYSGGSRLLEMSAPGVTKGNALAELCGSWGVTADEVAYFGDMPNDLSALTWAGHGYAMANGHPDLFDPVLGLGVAPSHQEDGVARVVEGILTAL
ncbi:Cof-type HAD-IIB family hydrolase [Nocardiopsis sp. EMB25]|uniref:HAD family hydrolase n=1 Tax=Nocardiopsis sp. EMB25 TaxID=2835867 RepID=UPI002283A34C|nr:HAD family hydrolase [Nocardiopsis sp. EMB25]MCY9785936.1 Cof-type HAD-IIB family hydrolase [Nocardiopsis sp. EMB25]